MKKTLHLLLPILYLAFTTTTLFSKEIPLQDAEKLVTTVIKRNARMALSNARNLNIIQRFTKEVDGQANFHIFNLSPTGFVIIAGEDRYNAVLAFSDESNLNLDNTEEYIGLWGTLSYHESRIQHIRANNIPATKAIQKEWTTLRNRNLSSARNRGIVVAPLTTTKWNQGMYYNGECPANEDTAESGPDGRTYCGCGPIAMAQLIKFHNYPTNGNGSNSYIDPIYGEQTGDFCNTTYNWVNMPDELDASNADVAKLIYQMGVSTYTYYSTDYTETYLSYMRNAFVNHFGFDQSANWFYDSNGDFNWVARNDLDRGRPLLLSGVSVFGGAHTWVADGYGYFDASGGEGTAEYFHFNWGWGGDNNGWFLDADESWFPRGDQPNNVEITYYFDRYVIQNLFPATSACQSPESFYTTGIENDIVYLNVNYPNGEQDISFRYREKGITEWTETPATSNFYQLVTGLELASEYEYQARRKCCPSDWSSYTETQTFTTAGFVPCTPLPASGMSADATSDNASYVYTVQPFGIVENQFRYRPEGDSEWIYSDNSTSYYRYLTGLMAGTTYEVQVSQLCSNGSFTEFSASFTFMTTGESPSEGGNDDENPPNLACYPADGAAMTTSSITDTYAYVYTPQPFGTSAINQFRYRPTGTTDWAETDISNLYYRFLTGLISGTTYEFQNRQECESGIWSDYSESATFTTTGQQPEDGGNTGGGDTDEETGETTDNTGSADCQTVEIASLYTSSVGNANAYVYTPQPFGTTANNQFRYRPTGTTDWIETDISSLYYRFLADLISGTTYEFQNRQECSVGVWSSYSDSATFTTTGQQPDNGGNSGNGGSGDGDTGGGGNSDNDGSSDCETVEVTSLYTSSVGNTNAYVYTYQPYGTVSDQFRYRPIGTTDWIYSDISTLYYRYLSDLIAGTQYEFQVRHECETDKWSAYSESATFTTTGSTNNSKISNALPAPLSIEALAATNPNYYFVENAQLTASIYPNPTTSQLNIAFNQPLKEGFKIMVIDQIGRQLIEVSTRIGSTSLEINVTNLISGIYMLQVHTENEVLVKKFIKN